MNNLSNFVQNEINQAIEVFSALRDDKTIIFNIERAVSQICTALANGNKILLAGNGGSAADAQHIAGELVNRFNYDRPGLCAFALTVDSSVITAIGNDYGYEQIFARQIRAVGRPGDIFWAYSTSGRSPNILGAMAEARQLGLSVIGFTGARGWVKTALCDITLEIPSLVTPKIQEGHLLIGHIICGLIESRMFPHAS